MVYAQSYCNFDTAGEEKSSFMTVKKTRKINSGSSSTWHLFRWDIRVVERHERPSTPPTQSSRSRADLREAVVGRSWSPTALGSCRDVWRPSPWQRAPAAVSTSVVDVASCSILFRWHRNNDKEQVQQTNKWAVDYCSLYMVEYSQSLCSIQSRGHCTLATYTWKMAVQRAINSTAGQRHSHNSDDVIE